MNQKGQILIETVIALGILVVGVFSIVNMSIIVNQLSRASSDRVTAVNLAREGIELVRLVRDSNWLDPAQTWPYSINVGSYIVDSEDGDVLTEITGNPPTVEACGATCQLYIDTNNRYTHTVTGTVTDFRRMIKIDIAAGLEVQRVVSDVSWTKNGRTYNYKIETHLSNWREE